MDGFEVLAEEAGRIAGEVFGATMIAIEALRQQPGFDDDKFCADIKDFISREGVTETQRQLLLGYFFPDEVNNEGS